MRKYKWINGERDYVAKAKQVYGKPLPIGVVIHHKGEDIVICENQAYHMLLHQRMRAIKGCGNPNKRKCYFCKEWDDVENLKETKMSGFYHVKCSREYASKYYYENKKEIREKRKPYEAEYRQRKKEMKK